jgi:hypothetical protein
MKETDEHDTHFICLSRDITKVKLIDVSQKSEARYRGLLDNLDAGVVHAADTSVIMSNKASELLFGNGQILGKRR